MARVVSTRSAVTCPRPFCVAWDVNFNIPTASLGSSVALLAIRRWRRSATSPVDRCCPLVTAVDRCLGHVGGTAGEDKCSSEAAAMASARAQVRPVLGGHLPRGQAARGGAAGVGWDSKLRPLVLIRHAPSGEGPVTWRSFMPLVTACARRGLPLPDAVRTQYGPMGNPAATFVGRSVVVAVTAVEATLRRWRRRLPLGRLRLGQRRAGLPGPGRHSSSSSPSCGHHGCVRGWWPAPRWSTGC
jgi:hypothetical protein